MTGVVINLTDLFRALPSMTYTSSLFRIVNKFHQEVFSDSNVPIGVNRPIDFRAVTLEHDRLLSNYRQEWAERFGRDSDHSDARFLMLFHPHRASLPFSGPGRNACAAEVTCDVRVETSLGLFP